MLSQIKTYFLKLSAENRELVAHSALAFLVRILAALATFFMSLVVARVLGAEQSGYYFLGLTTVIFLAALARMGSDNTVLRFTGASLPEGMWGEARSVLSKASLLTASSSIFIAGALWFGSEWLALVIFDKPQMTSVFRIMAPAIIGLALLTLVALSLQGLRRVVASVFTLNIGVNLLLVLALLIIGTSNAELAAGCYVGAVFITLFLCVFFWHCTFPFPEKGAVQWRVMFGSCMPLWVVTLMSQLTQWSGQFVAGVWVEPQSLAQLAVAQRTAMLTSFILVAVNLVVVPQFAALNKLGDQDGVKRLSISSVRLMLLFALPVLLVMLLFPKFLMGLFGPEFIKGALLLKLLAIGQFINVATGSVSYLLMMSGHEKDMRNVMLFTGPFAFLIAFILTPLYGATGSAAATAIAMATENLLAVWMVKRRLGFNALAIWRRGCQVSL